MPRQKEIHPQRIKMRLAGVPNDLSQTAIGIGRIRIEARQLRGLTAVVADGMNVPLEHPPTRVRFGQRHHFADGIGEDAQHSGPFGARDVVAQFLPQVADAAGHCQDPGAE